VTHIIKQFIPSTIWKRMRHAKQSSVDVSHHWLAQRLLTVPKSDLTGLTYLFEVQPYSLELVLQGHLLGIFATTIYREGYTHWYDPDPRGILPIHDFHVPRSMRKILHKEQFDVRVDSDFRQVVEECAKGRSETHITPQHIAVYMQLFEMGLAHSVSVWQDGAMVAGRYGVAIGSYFSGESMFHRVPNAAKVSLIRLAEILAAGGFMLRDTRWPTEHMQQFGGTSISRDEFHKIHSKAVVTPARFDPDAPPIFTAV
jgi:leucyl/phenylalanyl-tRNA---protein transferase